MNKKQISVLIAFLLSAVLTACSARKAAESLVPKQAWINSDLIGSVTEDMSIREQDDYAAAVNGPWKLEQGKSYHDSFQDAADAVLAKKKLLVTDASIPGKTPACLRSYYELASNWDRRNEDGAEPLRSYIEDISSISDKEDMYEFFADPARNPLYLTPITAQLQSVVRSEINKDKYAVYFSSPDLSLTDDEDYTGNEIYFNLDSETYFEKYLKVRDQAMYMLGRLGYSKGEASKLIGKCMTWEKKVAAADNPEAMTDLKDHTYTFKEACSKAKNFPFEKILRAWGFSETPYIIINTAYAKKLGRLCQDRYLENIKAFLIVNYCLRCSQYLDRESYDQMLSLGASKIKKPEGRGKSDDLLEAELMFDSYIGMTPMVGAMNQVYVENLFDDSQTKELNKITKDLIRGFKDIFAEEDWLSEKGRAACTDKLNAVKIHIAHQDFDSVDYGDLHFKSREEGGNFLDAYMAARRFEADHMARLSKQKYDLSYWDPLDQTFSTTLTNAFYLSNTNGIYICAGICERPIYSPDMSYEEKLACLFTVVGHEITHGFDKTGALYDKEGLKKTWLPDTDQTAFNDKCYNVSLYYSTLIPFPNSGPYDGNRVTAEATADMGGLRASLHLAEQEPDFDYDLYFRSFANMWRTNIPIEKEKEYFDSDGHPLAFYRVNVGLQQFDEFYKTYGVKKGDGMYLAPGKRIKVW